MLRSGGRRGQPDDSEENPPPSWAQDLMSRMEQGFNELNVSVKEIKKDTRALVNRMANVEKRVGTVEDLQSDHQDDIQALKKEVKELKFKVTYMESYSRRNNLLIVGLKEGLESGDWTKELESILRYILDRSDSDPAPEIERHHRSLRPRPSPTDPPRPYIIRLLRWTDRQLILRAAAKKQLVWDGRPFHVFQDFPADIQHKRAEYSDIKKKLRDAGIRYGLLFPAKLMVTVKGQKYIYTSPTEASRDLAVHLPSVF